MEALPVKITVVTCTVRKGGVDMLNQCLLKQFFKDFEWIIVTNRFDIWTTKTKIPPNLTLMWDPPKREGDYFSLHKAWNKAIRHASGELIVSIVDLTWINVDALSKLWAAYQADPKSCVTGIGHQYKEVVNGKPENMAWRDPRARTDFGSFYQVAPSEMELCVASFPKKGMEDIGGIDEIYDQGMALGEKEAMARMEKAGYKMFIDQSLEYRALHHPRLSEDHEVNYQKNVKVYLEHIKQIVDGQRLKVDYLNVSNTIKVKPQGIPS